MEWQFTDDEAGKLARQGALLAVARGDVDVAVESGFKWRFATAPKVMRDTFELATEDSRSMRVVFTPGPAIPLIIAAMRAGEEVSRRELSVYPLPISGAFTHCYVGLDGAFMPFLGFRVTEGDSHIQMALAPMLEFGEKARENAAAARFSLDLVGADDVEMKGALFPEHLRRAGPVQPLMPEDIIQLTEYWHAMYDSVVFLEDKLGITIPVHPPPFTLDELLNLNQGVEALRTGELDMSFRDASVHTHPDAVQMNAAWLLAHPPFFPARPGRRGQASGRGVEAVVPRRRCPDRIREDYSSTPPAARLVDLPPLVAFCCSEWALTTAFSTCLSVAGKCGPASLASALRAWSLCEGQRIGECCWLLGTTSRLAHCSAAITTSARPYSSPAVLAPSMNFHSHAIGFSGLRGSP